MKRNAWTLPLIWGLLLEFPVRYLVSPDPWIQEAEHWYFLQPSRMLLEMGFVLLALIPFFWSKGLKHLLHVEWTKDNTLFLLLGAAGSMLIFSSQQLEELAIIRQNNLMQFIPIWFATGLIIGIGQELTFRGLIFTGIDRSYGTKNAVFASTLLFVLGSIHSVRMIAYALNGYVFETFLLLSIYLLSGLFFVWVRIRTGNIVIPAIIHGIGNAVTWATFVTVKLHG